MQYIAIVANTKYEVIDLFINVSKLHNPIAIYRTHPIYIELKNENFV